MLYCFLCCFAETFLTPYGDSNSMPIGKVIRPRQETFLTPYGDSNSMRSNHSLPKGETFLTPYGDSNINDRATADTA